MDTPGGGSTGADSVSISEEQKRAIFEFLKEDWVVFFTLNKLASDAFRGGVSVNISSDGGKTKKPWDDINSNEFKMEWTKFAQDYYIHECIYGPAPITFVYNVALDNFVPHVPTPFTYNMYMHQGFDTKRKYTIEKKMVNNQLNILSMGLRSLHKGVTLFNGLKTTHPESNLLKITLSSLRKMKSLPRKKSHRSLVRIGSSKGPQAKKRKISKQEENGVIGRLPESSYIAVPAINRIVTPGLGSSDVGENGDGLDVLDSYTSDSDTSDSDISDYSHNKKKKKKKKKNSSDGNDSDSELDDNAATIANESDEKNNDNEEPEQDLRERGFQIDRYGTVYKVVEVFFPPFPDGVINTPVTRIMSRMKYYERALDNADYSGYWATHPYLAVEQNPSTGLVQPFEETIAAEGDAMLNTERYRMRINSMQQQEIMDAIHLAKGTRPEYVPGVSEGVFQKSRYRNSGGGGKDFNITGNPNAARPPYEHFISLGPNQRLSAIPMPNPVSNFADITQITMDAVFQILEIPPQLMSTNKAYSSDEKMAMIMYRSKLRDIQSKMLPLLQDLFDTIYSGSVRKYVISNYRKYKSSLGPEQIQERKQDIERAYQQFKINSGIEDQEETPEFSRIFKKQLKKQRKTFVIDQLAKNTKAVLSFNYVPQQDDLDTYQMLYENNIISEDTYAKYTGRAAGIPEDEILDSAEREKNRRMKLERAGEELEMQAKITEKHSPAAKQSPPSSANGALTSSNLRANKSDNLAQKDKKKTDVGNNKKKKKTDTESKKDKSKSDTEDKGGDKKSDTDDNLDKKDKKNSSSGATKKK